MKKVFTFFVTLLITATTFAQSPEKMGRQAVMRDSSDNVVNNQTEKEEALLTIEAKFIDFHLGDASHYTFEDVSGNYWDFSRSNSKNFEFSRLLDEAEMNTDNQGWGSAKELQGKWFTISYSFEERPLYQDGPMGTVKTIQEAELIEKEEALLTIEAKFIDFHLGDASHYTFEDVTGNYWDFSRSNSKNFEFSRLLDEAEMNTDNQGWGSAKELQGKWFTISYSFEERPLYQDGPMGTVKTIQEAELIEKVSNKNKANSMFSLESSIMKEPLERFVYSGNKSPDGSVELISEPIDPTSNKIIIKSALSSKTVEGVYLSPLKNYWSENGKYVILDNVDTYAGSGTYSIVLLNVESLKYVSIDMDQLFEGVDVGDREMLYVKNIVWLNDQSFFIESYVGYLGYSGHPGIDTNLKNKLGDKFANTDDIVTLPTRKYTIK
jgi:hypothetical protein